MSYKTSARLRASSQGKQTINSRKFLGYHVFETVGKAKRQGAQSKNPPKKSFEMATSQEKSTEKSCGVWK